MRFIKTRIRDLKDGEKPSVFEVLVPPKEKGGPQRARPMNRSEARSKVGAMKKAQRDHQREVRLENAGKIVTLQDKRRAAKARKLS